MSYGRSDDMSAILSMEGDRRCVDGCPHFKMEKPCPKRPPTGYCAFYDVFLRQYDILPGWEACPDCLDAGNSDDGGW